MQTWPSVQPEPIASIHRLTSRTPAPDLRIRPLAIREAPRPDQTLPTPPSTLLLRPTPNVSPHLARGQSLGLRQAEPTCIYNTAGTSLRANSGPKALTPFMRTLTLNNLLHLRQVRIISDLRWLTNQRNVDTFHLLYGSWRPRKARVTLWNWIKDFLRAHSDQRKY